MAYTTIDDPGAYFNTVLYTGNGTAIGSGGNVITGVGFQSDMTWLKSRSHAYSQGLLDSVRGATQLIYPNADWAGGANSESLTTWSADGFTVGSHNDANASGQTFASWNFKAGTTTGIAGSPSITPSGYSFNATSGFSIIAYTGTGSVATLPHGLGTADIGLIIVKKLSGAASWMVYHEFLGNTQALQLNTTAAGATEANAWNNTSPTSTLFTIGTGGDVNTSSATYIAYCFASIQGYSNFGGYLGNGDANGHFQYTGFRPAWVLIKRWDLTGDWMLFDNKRLGYNVDNNELNPNLSDAAGTTDYIDILSNGFKFRSSDSLVNGSGDEYVYIALAHSPFSNSSNVPNNAR